MSRRAAPIGPTESECLSIVPLLGALVAMGLATLAPAAGMSIRPWLVLALSIVLTGAAWTAFVRGHTGSVERSTARLAAWLVVLCGTGAYVASLAWPTLYPIAEGPDLVHHLTLAHFVQRHHTLPSDPAFGPYLGEMVNYPPGSHILAALAGEWLVLDAIRLVHPLMAAAVALKVGFVYHVVARLLPRERTSVPLAAAGALLVLVPHAYLLQSVVHYGFYSQVVSETFAVAMLWVLVVWHQQRARRWLVLFAACGVGVTLSWPVLLPVPVAAFLVVAAGRHHSVRARASDATIALGPIACVVAAFATARSESAGILSSGGDVLVPSPSLFGWPLLALVIVGAWVTARRPRAYLPLLAYAGACTLQIVGLIFLQHLLQATNYYLGFKTVHLLVYPLVVFAALGLAAGVAQVAGLAPSAWRTVLGRAAWALPVVVVVLLARTDVPKRPLPSPITQPVHHAGVWARAHVPSNCVDYLVEHWLTAYWLHIDVLGNARASGRVDTDPYDFRRTLGRWIGTGSMRFAIVGEWDIVPRDAREHMRVLQRFGAAAVVERVDGRGDCSDGTPGVDRIVSER